MIDSLKPVMLYEVNLRVDADIRAEFAEWLRGHIAEMLTLPGFESASWFEVVDSPADSKTVTWTVQYRVASRELLHDYFAVHADRMRGDGLARYSGKFTATRRSLTPVE